MPCLFCHCHALSLTQRSAVGLQILGPSTVTLLAVLARSWVPGRSQRQEVAVVAPGKRQSSKVVTA